MWREKSAIRFLIAPLWLASHKLAGGGREANSSRDIAAPAGIATAITGVVQMIPLLIPTTLSLRDCLSRRLKEAPVVSGDALVLRDIAFGNAMKEVRSLDDVIGPRNQDRYE